jgi:hypothetical protein
MKRFLTAFGLIGLLSVAASADAAPTHLYLDECVVDSIEHSVWTDGTNAIFSNVEEFQFALTCKANKKIQGSFYRVLPELGVPKYPTGFTVQLLPEAQFARFAGQLATLRASARKFAIYGETSNANQYMNRTVSIKY